MLLGSGEFHPGYSNGEIVAVKICKSSIDVEDFKGILAEIKIMGYLGNHANIIKFVGAHISRVDERKSKLFMIH